MPSQDDASKPKKEAEKKRSVPYPEPPKQFRGFFEAQPTVRKRRKEPVVKDAELICEMLEELGNEKIRQECAGREFVVDSLLLPCEKGCAPARLPTLRPCFRLTWGDGPSDRIETDDVEVLCLTAWNPYSNVRLKDLMAYVIVVGPSGYPETLPDGTPSVEVKPSINICFGDLDPCDEKNESSVSREIVLISRGAKEGPYFLFVAYCYDVEIAMAFGSVFQLDLVKS